MISKVLKRQSYQPDEKIFSEGEEGNAAYVVQEGEVEIVKIIDGREALIGTVGRGGIFGEMALIDDKPRMATARASCGTTIICVTRQAFEEKLENSDPFIRGLLNILANNIRTMTSK